MAFCNKCGAQLADDASFCPTCGNQTGATGAANNTSATTKNLVGNITNTNDTTNQYDPADIENNKILSLFSYLGILFLIPMFATNNSKFARFHVNQGIVLLIANIILGVVAGVIGAIGGVLIALIPILGWIIGGILCLVAFVVTIPSLIWTILGIVNAVQGKAKELPVIGKFRILK